MDCIKNRSSGLRYVGQTLVQQCLGSGGGDGTHGKPFFKESPREGRNHHSLPQ